ncbi:transporter [Herbiconiux sp. VKM Ac-1786]|uniref:SLAC1 family transporter n=1 Tax=Herbiconiux sp. VKM Ac-1786 TaxID=2783824 RepID=UPI00351C3EE4
MSQDSSKSDPVTARAEKVVARRIPLNTFAIALGLTGLATTWSAAAAAADLPIAVPQVFWGIALVSLIWLIAAHLARGLQSGVPLRKQLHDPAQGPLAAIVPIAGMLMGVDLFTWAPLLGAVVIVVCMTVTLMLAGWLLSRWLTAQIELGAVHGGYLLPTVAGGFVAARAAATIGLTGLGWAAFGVGLLFWAVVTTLILVRLVARTALPDALVPTLTVLLAPPAVGGLALFALDDGEVTPFSSALAGLTVLLGVVQLALIPQYRRLPFSLGFWSFTFPVAAVLAYAIEWTVLLQLPEAPVVGWVLAVVMTLFIGAIGIRSLQAVTGSGARRSAEQVLSTADALDAAVGR